MTLRNKEPRRRQWGIMVAAIRWMAVRRRADGDYQLHAASGGEFTLRD